MAIKPPPPYWPGHPLAPEGRDRFFEFEPSRLPRYIDLSQVPGALYKLMFRAGEVSAHLEILGIEAPIKGLFGRWDAINSFSWPDRRAAFFALLVAERDPGYHATGNLVESRNYVSVYDHMLSHCGPPALPVSPAIIESFIKRIAASLVQNVPVDGLKGEYRTRPISTWPFLPQSGRVGSIPPDGVIQCMHDLNSFIASPPSLPLMLRIAMVWAQILAITPFNYANEGVCRAVATLITISEGHWPIFLAEAFAGFEVDSREALQRAIFEGEWFDWFAAFLERIERVIDVLTRRVHAIKTIMSIWKDSLEGLRGHSYAHLVANLAVSEPVLTANRVHKVLNVSYPSTYSALNRLTEIGILKLHEGETRRRLFYAPDMIALFEDTAYHAVPLSSDRL